MNCPKCGKEMEPGYLYSNTASIWTKKAAKRTIFLGKDDVDLTEKQPTPAQLCRQCRTIIVEY